MAIEGDMRFCISKLEWNRGAAVSMTETAALFLFSQILISERNDRAVFDNLRADVQSVMERDPAAKSKWEVLLGYP